MTITPQDRQRTGKSLTVPVRLLLIFSHKKLLTSFRRQHHKCYEPTPADLLCFSVYSHHGHGHWTIATTVVIVHCVQKRTPTHVFFYISVENDPIFTKFSGNVKEKTSISPIEKLVIFCYW